MFRSSFLCTFSFPWTNSCFVASSFSFTTSNFWIEITESCPAKHVWASNTLSPRENSVDQTLIKKINKLPLIMNISSGLKKISITCVCVGRWFHHAPRSITLHAQEESIHTLKLFIDTSFHAASFFASKTWPNQHWHAGRRCATLSCPYFFMIDKEAIPCPELVFQHLSHLRSFACSHGRKTLHLSPREKMLSLPSAIFRWWEDVAAVSNIPRSMISCITASLSIPRAVMMYTGISQNTSGMERM